MCCALLSLDENLCQVYFCGVLALCVALYTNIFLGDWNFGKDKKHGKIIICSFLGATVSDMPLLKEVLSKPLH